MKNLILASFLVFGAATVMASNVKVQISNDAKKVKRYQLSGVNFETNPDSIKELFSRDLLIDYYISGDDKGVQFRDHWRPKVEGQINGDRIVGMEIEKFIGENVAKNKECELKLELSPEGNDISVVLTVKGSKKSSAETRQIVKKCLPDLVRKLSFIGSIRMEGRLEMEESVPYTYEKASDLMGKGSPVNEVTVE